MLKGMRKTEAGAIVKEYGQIPGVETDYAAQTIVWNVVSEDQRLLERAPRPIEEEFPEGCRAFFPGEYNYGRPLEVISHADGRTDVWLSTMVTTIPTYRDDQSVLIPRQQGKVPEFAQPVHPKSCTVYSLYAFIPCGSPT
jgi:5'-3' exoribonuclease 1